LLQGVAACLFSGVCFALRIAEKPRVTVGAIDNDFFVVGGHSQVF
jgi:hypothetical protein